MINEIEEIKKEYEESKYDLEVLRKKFDDLDIAHIQLVDCCISEITVPYIIVDDSGTPDGLILFPDNANIDEYDKLLTSAVNEYYSNHDFHDEVTGLLPDSLIKLYIKEFNIPIVAIYDLSGDSVRRMRAENIHYKW